MRICTAQGAGSSAAVPFNNEGGRDRMVLIWGTAVTNVDLEISPDAGVTWIVVQNFTAAGSAIVPLGGSESYEIRVTVTTGTAVNLDIQ